MRGKHAAPTQHSCTVGRVGLTNRQSNKKSFTWGTYLAAAHLISGWGHFLCVVVSSLALCHRRLTGITHRHCQFGCC